MDTSSASSSSSQTSTIVSSSSSVPGNTVLVSSDVPSFPSTASAESSSSSSISSSPTVTTNLPLLSRPDTAKRLRTASQHPVVRPLIQAAMKIIADAIDGEWITDEDVRFAAKTGQLLVGYESEYQELKDRCSKLERTVAEFGSVDDHRAQQDYIEAQALNQTLLGTTVEQMGKLVDERTNNLFEENADLHKRIKTLENTLAEVRKENLQLKSTLATYATTANSATNESNVHSSNTSSSSSTTTTDHTVSFGGPPDGLVRVKPKK